MMRNRTIADGLKAIADAQGIPLRTLGNVRADLAAESRKPAHCDVLMASMMLRHGRLTVEARDYVSEYLQKGSIR